MSERHLRTAVGVLALVGIGIAGYLTYLHYAGGSPYCIAGGSGCERVQESEYAKIVGIPVAVLGLVAYAALLVTALVRGLIVGCCGRRHRPCGSRVQRLAALRAARADRSRMPVVRRQRRRHRARRSRSHLAAAGKHVEEFRARTDGGRGVVGQIASMTEALCGMKLTLGEVEACPQGACPFWEHGGTVLESGCGLERLPLELDRTSIAEYFVELRERLEAARDDEERVAARRALAELVPPELSGR